MNPPCHDGQDRCESNICSRCGRPLSTGAGIALEAQNSGECICDDCYHDMLIPGPGDAHGNMS